jgi:hypothetical protein
MGESEVAQKPRAGVIVDAGGCVVTEEDVARFWARNTLNTSSIRPCRCFLTTFQQVGDASFYSLSTILE